MISTRTTRTLRNFGLVGGATALAIGVAVPALAAPARTTSAPTTVSTTTAAVKTGAKPTIVLVHGAWADASSFAPVTELLQKKGYTVLNAPNPLRSLTGDAANVAAFINQNTTGPVVLVGHSYGGSVITNAALQTPRVTSLVFIDAFAPAAGESALQLAAARPGSALAVADPSTVLNFVQYPGAPAGDVDTYVKPAVFASAFAGDLPRKEAAELAASQPPATLSASSAPSGTPAWKTIKSYFVVGTADKVIPPAEQMFMAHRAGATLRAGTIVKVHTSHLAMLKDPVAVTDQIVRAAKAGK